MHSTAVHALHGEDKRYVRVHLGAVENDHGHSCDDGPADIDQSGVGPVLSVYRVPRWWADLPVAERWLAECRGLNYCDANAQSDDGCTHPELYGTRKLGGVRQVVPDSGRRHMQCDCDWPRDHVRRLFDGEP
jgi:hypothetical protein